MLDFKLKALAILIPTEKEPEQGDIVINELMPEEIGIVHLTTSTDVLKFNESGCTFKAPYSSAALIPHYLYLVCEENIHVNEWCIASNTTNGVIDNFNDCKPFKADYNYGASIYCLKIVASNNPLLTGLPFISEEFVKAYVEKRSYDEKFPMCVSVTYELNQKRLWELFDECENNLPPDYFYTKADETCWDFKLVEN